MKSPEANSKTKSSKIKPPASSVDTSIASNRNLMLRVLSALVLAPLAIGAAWRGGLPFAAFWTIAALAVWWEWLGLIGLRRHPKTLFAGFAALLAMALLATTGYFDRALVIMLLVPIGIAAAIREKAGWIAGGFFYAGSLLLAPVILRNDPQYGFVAILFLFAVVWSSDIGGYFGGRLIGGAKLAPSISPKKTRSGAIAGTATAMIAALAIVYGMEGQLPLYGFVMTAVTALLLSVASQAGDLFESAIKRHFGAKDASNLIPGHGGVMDRLDGFIFASFVAACLGALRGGFDLAGRGAMLW